MLRDTAADHGYLADALTASGVIRIGFADKWQVFAKAGLFVWDAEADVRVVRGATGSASVDDSGTDLTWGLGVKARFQPSWTVRGEWERFELDDPVDLLSIGVEFSFWRLVPGCREAVRPGGLLSCNMPPTVRMD